MPGSMFSWESEDMLVNEYEEAILAKRAPSVAKHHYAGLVVAVVLDHRDEDMRQHSLPQHTLRGYLETTLRALDALPIVVNNELRQKKASRDPRDRDAEGECASHAP